jgi:hypothetical protein
MLAIKDTVRPKLHGTIHDKETGLEYDSNIDVTPSNEEAIFDDYDAIMEDD